MHPRRYQSSLPLSVSPYAMRFDRSLPLCIVAFKSPPSPSFISYSSRLLYLSQILRSQPFIIPFSSSNHPILSSARIFSVLSNSLCQPFLPTFCLVNVVTSPHLSSLSSHFLSLQTTTHFARMPEGRYLPSHTLVYSTESPFICESQYQIIDGSTKPLCQPDPLGFSSQCKNEHSRCSYDQAFIHHRKSYPLKPRL